jgi:hypothetical protein
MTPLCLAPSLRNPYDNTVDFERVLKTLLAEFERHRIRYAAIGGFAVGALGVGRATMDLDFLIHRDDLGRLHGMLAGLGYQQRVQTENVSHYVHADAEWGSVDFLHAFRTPSLTMLERATSHAVFGTQQIRIARPEDVIGLKVQAMANNPLRRARELVDIEALLALHGPRLDWQRIQGYFDLFEMSQEGHQLQERFGHAQ